MSRPREFDYEQVLHAATDVFREYGYNASSYELLMKGTNLKKQSLYGAFGDKKSLFEKSISFYCSNFLTRFEKMMSLNSSGLVALLCMQKNFLKSDPEKLDVGCLIVNATLEVTFIMTGVLIANAMTLASVKVPQEKIGSVISIVFSGFTIAGILGVPLGTYIGQTSGWRMTFWSIVILGGVLFVISLFALPRDVKGEKGSLKLLVKFITHPKIILTALIPALSIGATYAVYTYLTPLLEEAVGIPRNYISAVLLMYGIISVVSNLLAGAIAKRESISKLRFVFIIQAVILGALFLTSHLSILALIIIGLMSLVMYLAVPALQMYFIQMADRYFQRPRTWLLR